MPRRSTICVLVFAFSYACGGLARAQTAGVELNSPANRLELVPIIETIPVPPAIPVESTANTAAGNTAAGNTDAADPQPSSTDRLQRLITQTVRDNLPDAYEDKRGWGRTKEIWAGIKISGSGLRLSSNSRKKTVNHGTWKSYRFELIEPEQQFRIQVSDPRELPDGRVGFDASIDANVSALGRVAEWRRGVQLIAFSADATAKVRLTVRCNLGMRLDPTRLPPDVVLDPMVESANLRLLDFRLNRVSDFHGPVVHELGKAVRDILEDKLDDERPKLAARINREIDKNRKDLRLSLSDIIGTKLGAFAAKRATDDGGSHLPADAQEGG